MFWELSIGEINDLLESYTRQEERELKKREAALKDEIMVLFNQALQIGNVVGHIINPDVELRMPAEYYPELFVTENKTDFTEQTGDKPKLSPEMELHKARMDDFIFRHNMAVREREAVKRGGENGGNDT